jgi:hypothetical protein
MQMTTPVPFDVFSSELKKPSVYVRYETPRTRNAFAVVAQILGWSASTAVRMTKRYGHIRPEVQRQALVAAATSEIQPGVNQIVHQVENEIELKQPN